MFAYPGTGAGKTYWPSGVIGIVSLGRVQGQPTRQRLAPGTEPDGRADEMTRPTSIRVN